MAGNSKLYHSAKLDNYTYHLGSWDDGFNGENFENYQQGNSQDVSMLITRYLF